MFELPDYRTVEALSSNEDIQLYRLVRRKDGVSVIAKTIRDELPGSGMSSAFQYEYDIMQKLGGKGAVEPYNLLFAGDRPVLLAADIGGNTMEHFLRKRSEIPGLQELLGISIAVADCLVQLHREKITLHQITPFHLMVNPDTLQVKFVDLRMCSTVSGKSPLTLHTDRTDSSLPYVSPEQTGRTGLAPDFRSDFYSLGIILYEWLTGTLPFEPQDALEIVYRHLASTPEPAHVRAPFLPKVLSDIIAKCMAKMPDGRYASAYGIMSDLMECMGRLRESGQVGTFTLASRDIPDRWMVPEILFGRIAEQHALMQAFRRSAEGSAEIVWVSGSGGIGKTFFVQSTLKLILPSGIFCATAKVDPGQPAKPYDMWVQAIGQLVGQLLTESELMIEVWKLRIMNAVGDYGQLLTELVPRLELLIGKQPDVQPLPAVEAQHRFHLVMNRFIQLFLGKDQTLVLFFDDLQWADEASLQYIENLLTDLESKRLLVVGAYRDTDTVSTHPVKRLQQRLDMPDEGSRHIHLQGLGFAELRQLLQETMRSVSVETDALAEVLLHKTEGNPFYLKQFLQDLNDRGLLAFDDRSRCWHWNVQRISEMNVPDDAATYMSDKLQHLPGRTVHAISRAACFGSRFEWDALVSVAGLSEQELLEAVGIAVHERLLQPVGGGNNEYRFQHDRIQQAAYTFISEEERPELHLQIGLLLSNRLKSGGEGNIFTAVTHLNQALHAIAQPQLLLELAELNLRAGLEAKHSTAYESALGYFRHATELLKEDVWDKHYELAYRCYKERAELAFLCSYFAEAKPLFELLLGNSATNLDKAHIYALMIQLESNNDNYTEMLALSRKALNVLGIRHQFEPSAFGLSLRWIRLRWKLRKYTIENLRNLPPMSDESRRAAMSVLSLNIGNSRLVLDPKIWLSAVITLIETTLDYGMTPEASIGFIGYSLIQDYYFHHYKTAYDWGMLACEISQTSRALNVQAYVTFSICNDSWRQYNPALFETLLMNTDKTGLESGDLWRSNQSLLINCVLQLKFGYPLGEIYNRLVTRAADFQRNNNRTLWFEACMFAEFLARLIGYRAPDDPYADTDVYASEYAEPANSNEINLQEIVCISHYIPDYILGNYRSAYKYLMKSASFLDKRKGDLFEHSTQYMYEALVCAELYEEASERDRGSYLTRIRICLKKLKKYAARVPANYRHKYLLVYAEFARLTRKYRKAESLFEQAIEVARQYGFIHDAGLAAECYGKYGMRQGKLQLARIYLTEAYEAYREWGAGAKTAEMEMKYGHLLHVRRETGMEMVDYLSVVMSAQALSGEMEMNRLLNTLMSIMLRNAGAEYGAVVFEHEGKWVVEAHGTAERLAIESVPLEQAAGFVPTAIISYVARTKEEVVLQDASGDGMFTRHPYVTENRLKSVLCLPIMHQGKLVCVLYLENRLSEGVFTPERLDVVKLLCSQCAISIDNAILYSGIQFLKNNLERQVEDRTRSLERSMRETAAALSEMSVYEERNRIAKEIHDVVGHTLTSTMLQIEAGKRLLHKNMDGAVLRLQGAQDLVRHSLNEIRRSVHMLKEGQAFDLTQALNQLIQDTEQNTGVVIRSFIKELPEMSSTHKKIVYHALQEGLTNGIRHGGSTEFLFTLEPQGSTLQFRLEDYGKGAGAIVMGFGLKAMKERVEQFGGSLHIAAEPDRGCRLLIDLPYPARLGRDKQ